LLGGLCATSAQANPRTPLLEVPLHVSVADKWRNENFEKKPGQVGRVMGVSYLLELLDSTLVNTTALVDQVCSMCKCFVTRLEGRLLEGSKEEAPTIASTSSRR